MGDSSAGYAMAQCKEESASPSEQSLWSLTQHEMPRLSKDQSGRAQPFASLSTELQLQIVIAKLSTLSSHQQLGLNQMSASVLLSLHCTR